MDTAQQFRDERQHRIRLNGKDEALLAGSRNFFAETFRVQYSYNFDWLSRPIIQYPQDIVAMQEIIWKVKPDLIIETGIAHGGSLIFSASMLALLDYCDAIENRSVLDPSKTRRRVLGIDIDIRPHNREAILAHPMADHIDMIQGSAIDPAVIEKVRAMAAGYQKVLVCLDSNHTHDHVLAELEAYAPLTSIGSYCCVFDTVVDDLPDAMFYNRPWGKGNNPKTAVKEYLGRLAAQTAKDPQGLQLKFEVDADIHNKLLITVAPEGYLYRPA